MKIFTHSYNITIYEDGKFCWKNHGWVENDVVRFSDVLLLAGLIAILIVELN